jgi:rubrerythrin
VDIIRSHADPRAMEGGFNPDTFLEGHREVLQRSETVLELAMVLETQAMDLLLRFADKSTQIDTRQALYEIAEEEKIHIQKLAEMFETTLAG